MGARRLRAATGRLPGVQDGGAQVGQQRGDGQCGVARRHRVGEAGEVAGGGIELHHEGGAVIARRHRDVRDDFVCAPPLAERGRVPHRRPGRLEEVGQGAVLGGDVGPASRIAPPPCAHGRGPSPARYASNRSSDERKPAWASGPRNASGT